MNDTLIDRPDLRTLARLLAVTGFSGLLLSTAGAFDTEAARFWPRLGYWMCIAAVSIVTLEGAHRLLAARLHRASEWRLRASGLVLLVLPLTAIAVLGCKLLFGGWPSIGGFGHLLPGMTVILTSLQFVLVAFASSEATEACVDMRQPEALAELLPLPLRGARLDALEAEDHYVRVHTSAGQALIRMRFSDAVAAVSARQGVQPHRSWWVAQESVVAMRSEGGRAVLTLVGGQQVPVSRRARPLLGPLFGSNARRGQREGGP